MRLEIRERTIYELWDADTHTFITEGPITQGDESGKRKLFQIMHLIEDAINPEKKERELKRKEHGELDESGRCRICGVNPDKFDEPFAIQYVISPTRIPVHCKKLLSDKIQPGDEDLSASGEGVPASPTSR